VAIQPPLDAVAPKRVPQAVDRSCPATWSLRRIIAM